jgi:signal transduction histidine kinase
LELPSPKQLRQANEELHKLERQLMHSQKLEALGTLAGGVAHDLNNTLVPILALSKLALDDLPETSPVRPDIETIVRASERARDLVKQILAFSRKQTLEKLQVDVALDESRGPADVASEPAGQHSNRRADLGSSASLRQCRRIASGGR